ncbi:MAG: spore germination protein [Clostridiales bacterium]|nr:spore germination protein [Clostridiales bacterium]
MSLIKNLFRMNKAVNTTKQNDVQKNNKSQKRLLTTSLQQNINIVKETLGKSSDIVIREFRAGEGGKLHIAVMYTDGLADKKLVQDFILEVLMLDLRKVDIDDSVLLKKNSFKILTDLVLPVGDVKEISDFDNLFTHLLSGDTVILMNGYGKGIVVSSKGWADRSVEEPSSQTVVRGPKDGFTETLRVNTALIRRRIKDPNLWIEVKPIGRRTKTDVAVVYIKGVAGDKIVEEVHRRLDKINIDGILESGYIEELIQDETFTPFPTVFNTERPDVVAAGLLEGRIAILVDGTPFALLVPALFIHYFQASEDYYQRFDIGTLLRLIRYLSFFLTLLVPSMYVAVTTFHQEMIPTPLLISLAAQREGVPFPAILEVLLMEVTFEILREAGVRMPRAIGQAISIVGALVLGEASVKAGIISPAMVVVVSITAISSFVSPTFNMAIAVRIIRFIFTFLAATFGLYGIAVGLLAMVLHLCSLRSFGIPYMSPMAPLILADQKDTIIRFPHWAFFKRPRLMNQKDVVRQQRPIKAKPKPPQDGR